MTGFHETWRECQTIGRNPTFVVSDALPSYLTDEYKSVMRNRCSAAHRCAAEAI
jgi:hypothetical protein